jgi:hypothetical protein
VGGEKKKFNFKKFGDAQMVSQDPRAENAQGEKVTTQTSISAESASDRLVAEFLRGRPSVARWCDACEGTRTGAAYRFSQRCSTL